MFKALYGDDIKEPKKSVKSVSLNGTYFQFNQSEFIPEGEFLRPTGMDSIGFAYIPSGCGENNNATSVCRASIVFHGCSQAR